MRHMNIFHFISQGKVLVLYSLHSCMIAQVLKFNRHYFRFEEIWNLYSKYTRLLRPFSKNTLIYQSHNVLHKKFIPVGLMVPYRITNIVQILMHVFENAYTLFVLISKNTFENISTRAQQSQGERTWPEKNNTHFTLTRHVFWLMRISNAIILVTAKDKFI